MILVTIIRISGIKVDGEIDQVWESFFIILAAEIGIILTSVSAFRTFFVARQRRNNEKANPSPGDHTHWYSQDSRLLKRILTLTLWRSKSKGQSTSGGYEADQDGQFPMEDLPDIHAPK